ncbi:MAG: sulfotransferase domain-containing protein, partial [Myxococcota bacterium]
NHYQSYTDLAYASVNGGDRVGDPLPRCPDDPRVLWRDWMTRGWFEWESEGYPFWSNLRHTQTWWDYRHQPNFLWLHYNDMLADLEGAVRRIAAFCRIDASEETIARTVRETTFARVKRRAEQLPEESDGARFFFRGGAKRFFFKGSNGRWRGVLMPEDLALYEQAAARVLSPECVKWLESGGPLQPQARRAPTDGCAQPTPGSGA